jgi:hypothetical protein
MYEREIMMADSNEIRSQKSGLTAYDALNSIPFIPIPGSVPFVPIINFSLFLGSSNSDFPEKWPQALTDAYSNIAALCHKDSIYDPDIASLAMLKISSNAFGNFVKFCNSTLCDLNSKTTLYLFLTLVPRIIEKLPSSCDRRQLLSDFNSFLENKSSRETPLASDSDASLFERVAQQMKFQLDNACWPEQ